MRSIIPHPRTATPMRLNGVNFGRELSGQYASELDKAAMDYALQTRAKNPSLTHIYDLGGATGARGTDFAQENFDVTVIDRIDSRKIIQARNQQLFAQRRPLIAFEQNDIALLNAEDLSRANTALVNLGRVNHFLSLEENKKLFAVIAKALPGVGVAVNFTTKKPTGVKKADYAALFDAEGNIVLHDQAAFRAMLKTLGYSELFRELTGHFCRVLLRARP